MNTGIGQHIKGIMRRAQHYWAELTEASEHQQRRERHDQQEAVHERYGGVRGQGMDAAAPREADALRRDRQQNS